MRQALLLALTPVVACTVVIAFVRATIMKLSNVMIRALAAT